MFRIDFLYISQPYDIWKPCHNTSYDQIVDMSRPKSIFSHVITKLIFSNIYKYILGGRQIFS